ncbi:hypothetical protein RJ640_012136 [Escallonia rubra]|uniref:Cycloidea-like protein n=1 Tax=Escallonia rubra TaxID=112253 RepID=A0AA88RJF2_9ASTE|nr:hypothetical protein RJ640_012136 [Escallonia rubra]
MFSSSNTSNSFPQLFSSIHVFPPPTSPFFATHDSKGESFLDQHCHDLLEKRHCLLPASAATQAIENDFTGRIAATDSDMNNFLSKKKPMKKKDPRKSKIITAQGPRERRVRLSIEISRKFFDLQDMLGFDKASKTLDWLLTKSNLDIKELMHIKRQSCTTTTNTAGGGNSSNTLSSTMISDNCEVISSEKKPAVISVTKDEKARHPHQISAKESRAKARARARERTRAKTSITKLENLLNKVPDVINPIPIPANVSRPWAEFETCKKLLPSFKVDTHHPIFSRVTLVNNEAPSNDIVGESIVTNRPFKPSLIFGYQQNLAIPKDHSSFNNYSFNMADNWDLCSTFTRLKPSRGIF